MAAEEASSRTLVCAMNITGRDAECLAEALLHRDSRTLLSRPKHPGSHVPRPRIALNVFIPQSLESPDFRWWLAGLGRGGDGVALRRTWQRSII